MIENTTEPKFIVTRKDGKSLPETARFFVMRLDDASKPDYMACRAALVMYVREAMEIDQEAALAAHKLLSQTPRQPWN
jgi:hypothetical protein